MTKNSQPFGKKFQKTVGGIFFDSRCMYVTRHSARLARHLLSNWNEIWEGSYLVAPSGDWMWKNTTCKLLLL